jgi:hypothetical protein
MPRLYLQLRGSVWWYRRAVPVDLVNAIGKREVLRRLGANRKSAERRASVETVETDAIFDEARRKLASSTKSILPVELSDAEIWSLSTGWFAEASKKDESLTHVDVDGVREWLAALSDQDERTIPFHQTRAFLKARGLDIQPGTPTFRRLSGLIREGMIQRERSLLARFSAIPGLTNPRFADIPMTSTSPKSITFEELLARFRHHQSKPRSLKTTRKRIAQDRELCDIIGADTIIDKIGREDARRVQEVVSRRRVAVTANTYVGALTAVMKFAVDEGLLSSSPANNLKLASEGIPASELRLPFTDNELRSATPFREQMFIPPGVGCRCWDYIPEHGWESWRSCGAVTSSTWKASMRYPFTGN